MTHRGPFQPLPFCDCVLGGTRAGSELVGPRACGRIAGSKRIYLSLVFGRVNALSFHQLFPLNPAR